MTVRIAPKGGAQKLNLARQRMRPWLSTLKILSVDSRCDASKPRMHCGRINPHKRPAWPASLQLSLVLAARAFLTGAAQGFGERSATGLLLRLALRRRCHRRAGIVAWHALRPTFAPAPPLLLTTHP